MKAKPRKVRRTDFKVTFVDLTADTFKQLLKEISLRATQKEYTEILYRIAGIIREVTDARARVG